jgi:hypothetical protein
MNPKDRQRKDPKLIDGFSRDSGNDMDSMFGVHNVEHFRYSLGEWT